MRDLILWTTCIVAYFTYTFPPLQLSERKAARAARVTLSALIGGALGYGFGGALFAVLAG